jgi:ferrochelatase
MVSLQSGTRSHTAEQIVPRSATTRQSAVLLINLGTPDSPEVPDVRRYLAEFLSDPEVIQLPAGLRWLNRPLGRMIAHFRGPKSAAMYKRIWAECGSPLDSITREQASLLGEALPAGWRVYMAMRYGQPSIANTMAEVAADGVEDLVVLPMYPHFSGPTTGTALRELYGVLKRDHIHISVTTRNTWYDDGGYIHAQAKLIEEYTRLHGLSPDNAHLVFSAHGLPTSYVRRGDPYPAHVARTVELVTRRLGWPRDRTSVSYQSRLGPVEWLEPNTIDTLKDLVAKGEKRVVVCPVSFTTDCLETLEELDVRYRSEIEKVGGELYLCPALNTTGPFISALKNLVVRGPKPVSDGRVQERPLISRRPAKTPTAHDYDSLVMIGVSLPNRVGGGGGAQLVHTSEGGLHRAKKSQREVPELLRKLCADGHVREAMVWNTCFRFEFYGWPGDVDESLDHECIVRRVRRHLFGGADQGDVPVNVLCGADAWQHLMRTVVGINSILPGDRDVIEQLQTAHRVAQRAGTAGPMLERIVADAISLDGEVREETGWGDYAPGYCLAAISKVVESTGLELADCRSVVVGGSTTSRSVLTTLRDRFEVPSRLMTLAYRGHGGGQIKELRKAIENGRRMRVQSYCEDQVVEAIGKADVVFFGIDRDEPVLEADDLRGFRDYTAQPLTVVDFNTFGSTRGLESIPGVTLIDAKSLDEAVASFADTMCSTEEFSEALGTVESWIDMRVPTLKGTSTQPQRCHRSALRNIPELDEEDSADGKKERSRTCARCTREMRLSGQEVLEEAEGVILGSVADGC